MLCTCADLIRVRHLRSLLGALSGDVTSLIAVVASLLVPSASEKKRVRSPKIKTRRLVIELTLDELVYQCCLGRTFSTACSRLRED